MHRFDTRDFDVLTTLRARFSARLESVSTEVEESVRTILRTVRTGGDAAVLDYTRRWDNPDAAHLRVPEAAIQAATERVQQTELWDVMRFAAERIRRFHERQLRQSWSDFSLPGEVTGQIIRPIGRVGAYIPGGTASYPSSVLMVTIPGLVAGVPSLAIATPPSRESAFPPDATLAAAHLAGVHEVYAMGGAQAVAAFAYGTESVAPVDKIVGPGNLYVNLAKRFVYGTVGIDMLAGPSEVAVLADETADPTGAALDILAQSEHDPNCSVLVASPSESFIAALLSALEREQETLPRASITRKVLEKNGFLVQTKSVEEAAEIVSLYAPEHLHLCVREPWALLGRIQNAGAILLGDHTSASLGDYLAGPSHTLPTAGCARFASPLNVDDFIKKSSVIYFAESVTAEFSAAAATFAEFEGLDAHVRAAQRGQLTKSERDH